MFCSFASSSAYGWVEFCQRQFGDVPVQICFEWNTPSHTTDDAVPPSRRSFTKGELQRFFDAIDDEVDREYEKGSKTWLSTLRNSVAFKVCYAYGLRRRELAMLDITDFGPNPHVRRYGSFGALTVRWAKGTAGSGPRRRTVLTVPEFDWVVDLLHSWLSPGRRDYFPTADQSRALWPSERAPRIHVGTLSDSFTQLRQVAGLPPELGMHCLRHSYVTHLIEAGYDPHFIQTQVGHAYASTTSLYTSVSADYKQRVVQRMIAERIRNTQEDADG